MFRWMRSTQPDLDAGFTHMVVSVTAVLALMGASVAVGIALYEDGDPVIATQSAASVPVGETIDFGATPGDAWKPFDPTLQPAPSATEHAITIRATEGQVEIAPGLTQEMWTFNG
jgi:nitrite reductase (NO-forming)